MTGKKYVTGILFQEVRVLGIKKAPQGAFLK